MDTSSAWLDVSRETSEKLQAFAAKVLRWNKTINLISKQSAPNIWERHILDSAQIFPLANPTQTWLDLGSGSGFPGIVMAIMGAQDITLVESDQRKATFLREVTRTLSLNATIICKRIEDIPLQNAQIITARALASLTDLLAYASTHLAQSGKAIFPKGRIADKELAEAKQSWHFDHTSLPSRIDPESTIFIIKNIQKR
jgi:16S rRNA (guanine527-N7)-methyltransferase